MDEHGREQTIRRLEGFSDIVIGFSLGQLSLSLVVPLHAIAFVQQPVALVAFLITFSLVARFWWVHFKIFRDYFQLNRLTITLNFFALAALIVQIFSLQLFLHFAPVKDEGLVGARIYGAFFSLAFGALGVLLALGLFYKPKPLSLAARRAGVRDMLSILGPALGCALGNVLVGHGFSTTDSIAVKVQVENGVAQTVATMPTSILLFTFYGWLAGTLAGRLAPRVFPSLRLPVTGAAPEAASGLH